MGTPEHERETVAEPRQPTGDTAPERIRRTRLSGTWVAVIVAVIVLIFLLVFILENLDSVTVRFFGAAGTLPLGVGLLFAAVAGALLVVLVGSARILQLRRAHRRVRVARRPTGGSGNAE